MQCTGKQAQASSLAKFVFFITPFADKFYLRRFLRARQHDLKRAKEMFLNHLKWRKEMGVDTIIETFHFHERDAFLTLYPQGYHKTDRLGRPIYIQHLGQINVKAIARVTTEERMLKFHIQEYERALRYIFPACSLIAGRHISQTLAVMDLKGVGLRHLNGEVKRILSTITRTDQDNYPETLGKTLIINAPTVFRAIWAVVKPMLDPRTQAKIQVCAADYMPELTRWVDPENIPSYLGGKSNGSLIDDVGPWNEPGLVAEIDAQRARLDGMEVESPAAALARAPFGTALGTKISLTTSTTAHSDVDAAVIAGASGAEGSATDRDTDKDEFFDATARRMSSGSTISAYLSAEEGYYSSEGPGPALARRVSRPLSPTSDGESFTADSPAGKQAPLVKSAVAVVAVPPAQVSILARVRALEERLPVAERRVRPYLPPTQPPPSRTVGQGTLLGRVEALEMAMGVLLRAQEVALDDVAKGREQAGCSACCTVM